MKATIEPGRISGIIRPPASKSLAQRAYAAALLHSGITIIHHAGHSNDEHAALNIIQQLGATITARTDDSIEIRSNGVQPNGDTIHCGESGLAARLFTPIAALSDKEIMITGEGSLPGRSMEGFGTVLPLLGVSLHGFNGRIPFVVKGPLQAKSIGIDASGGSQFLSGLLFALSSAATHPITIEVTGLKSRPYIDLTLDVLTHFGKPIAHDNYRKFHVDTTQFTHKERVEISIDADWSSAAFFLVAGAIVGDVTIDNLDLSSRQADRAIIDVLQSVGASVTINDNSVRVGRSSLREFDFDATHSPDLFPILAILAACCNGESRIMGVHRLFDKESNRVESITEMLQAFDVHFSVEEDTLFIEGVKQLQGTVIESYNDHRIVMAAAIGALRARSRVDILDAEAVNKSYPAFFDHLALCGGTCTFSNE